MAKRFGTRGSWRPLSRPPVWNPHVHAGRSCPYQVRQCSRSAQGRPPASCCAQSGPFGGSSRVEHDSPAFIRDTWGIDSLYPDIAAVPDSLLFDAIVAINVLEHVYDITSFLGSITKLLSPDGVLFMSTVNATSLEAMLLRGWWSMCKEHDHVSFPSPEGIARACQTINLRAERVWSSELPFELPISALVAARDWTRARHSPSSATSDSHLAGNHAAGAGAASKSGLARFYTISAPFDPVSRLLGGLGRAATVKARLARANAPA